MLRLILNRTALQLVVSGAQVATLALFVVVWPRQAAVPRLWAADYFMAMAVMTPIFMFFSFELRKITAASQDPADLMMFHRRRVSGVLMGAGLSLLCLPALLGLEMQRDVAIFLAVLSFKIASMLGDQISAHYEFHDDFRGSALSNALRSVVFLIVGIGAGLVIGPTPAVFAASAAMLAVSVLHDRPRGAFGTGWSPAPLSGLPRATWEAGFGSFLISMTLYGPRMVAAFLLGEGGLLVMGVGQTLNRFGQILSNSLSQTLMVLQKRAGFDIGRATWIIFGLQVVVLAAMIAAMPLWNRVFGYAAGETDFGLGLILLLIFGLASQFNYLIQSLNLVRQGTGGFVLGPVVFLAVFALALAALHLAVGIDLLGLIGCSLAARAVQIGYNLAHLRGGPAAP